MYFFFLGKKSENVSEQNFLVFCDLLLFGGERLVDFFQHPEVFQTAASKVVNSIFYNTWLEYSNCY